MKRKLFLLLFLLSALSLFSLHSIPTSAMQAKPWVLTQELVMHGAEKLYRKRIAELEQAQILDTNSQFLQRIKSLSQALIHQASLDYPESVGWQWEIHSTNDEEETAYCMAGGKILVNISFVQKLALNDAELSMLLSHEISHALLLHNLKEYQEAIRLDPKLSEKSFEALEDAVDHDTELKHQLAAFNALQELEADQGGLRLAWRADWDPEKLLSLFKKMARFYRHAKFSDAEHPSEEYRWSALRAYLDRQKKIPQQ